MMGRQKGQRIGPLYGYVAKEKGAGGWCYKARLAAGLTINELAEKSRVSRRTVIRIEAGESSAGRRVDYRLRRALKVQ